MGCQESDARRELSRAIRIGRFPRCVPVYASAVITAARMSAERRGDGSRRSLNGPVFSNGGVDGRIMYVYATLKRGSQYRQVEYRVLVGLRYLNGVVQYPGGGIATVIVVAVVEEVTVTAYIFRPVHVRSRCLPFTTRPIVIFSIIPK